MARAHRLSRNAKFYPRNVAQNVGRFSITRNPPPPIGPCPFLVLSFKSIVITYPHLTIRILSPPCPPPLPQKAIFFTIFPSFPYDLKLDASSSRDKTTLTASRPLEFLLTLGNCIFLRAVFHRVRNRCARVRVVGGKTNSRLSADGPFTKRRTFSA